MFKTDMFYLFRDIASPGGYNRELFCVSFESIYNRCSRLKIVMIMSYVLKFRCFFCTEY